LSPSDALRWPQAPRGSSNLGHSMAQAIAAPIWDRPIRTKKKGKELGLNSKVLGNLIS